MTEKLFVGGFAVRKEGKLGRSPLRKLPGNESLCIRGINKYSGEGEGMAPVSLVMTPVLLAIRLLAREKKWMEL